MITSIRTLFLSKSRLDIIIRMYMFAPRVPTKLNIHRPPLTDHKPNSIHANMAETKLKIQIARDAPRATRLDLFSDDVSIKLDDAEKDGTEDGAFGVA